MKKRENYMNLTRIPINPKQTLQDPQRIKMHSLFQDNLSQNDKGRT